MDIDLQVETKREEGRGQVETRAGEWGEGYREAEVAVDWFLAVAVAVPGSLSKSDSDLRCEDAIGHAISGCLYILLV